MRIQGEAEEIKTEKKEDYRWWCALIEFILGFGSGFLIRGIMG